MKGGLRVALLLGGARGLCPPPFQGTPRDISSKMKGRGFILLEISRG